MKLAFKTIDYLIENPSTVNLFTLNRLLSLGIPFNAPHGFKIKKISDEEILIDLPHRRSNHNHLGGIHACAMATLGEFCAGLGIIKSFGIANYRLIMSELRAQYFYQGRKPLIGRSLPQFDKEQMQQDLRENGKSIQTLETTICDIDGQLVAIITTTWQLKVWNQVKTKHQ